jgi:hypothetical protein
LIAVPLYVWLLFVVADDPLSEHSGAWITWIVIGSTALVLIAVRLLKPWLSAHHDSVDQAPEGRPSLPPSRMLRGDRDST